MNVNVKYKKLTNTAIVPTYGSGNAACLDLYADLLDEQGAKLIYPHSTEKIGTGIAFQPPENFCGFILARSGVATKYGLRPANCIGVADPDYTGEYIVALHNDTDKLQYVHHGDRIAQLMFVEKYRIDLQEVETLNETERGANGFGSTGR